MVCVANLERGYGRRIENEKAPGIAPGAFAILVGETRSVSPRPL